MECIADTTLHHGGYLMRKNISYIAIRSHDMETQAIWAWLVPKPIGLLSSAAALSCGMR
jgi:hypothetical protein